MSLLRSDVPPAGGNGLQARQAGEEVGGAAGAVAGAHAQSDVAVLLGVPEEFHALLVELVDDEAQSANGGGESACRGGAGFHDRGVVEVGELLGNFLARHPDAEGVDGGVEDAGDVDEGSFGIAEFGEDPGELVVVGVEDEGQAVADVAVEILELVGVLGEGAEGGGLVRRRGEGGSQVGSGKREVGSPTGTRR